MARPKQPKRTRAAELAEEQVGDRKRRTPRAVMLRLTDDEFRRVESAAAKAVGKRYWRVSIAAWCRDAVLVALGKAGAS